MIQPLADLGGAQFLTDSLFTNFGMELFEEDIDNVVFQTTSFLTNSGEGSPFATINDTSQALAAIFAICMLAGMGYKMMIKSEPFDILKVIRLVGISFVMITWYSATSILGPLSYIPNCIGSYTHDLYVAEAMEVQGKFDDIKVKMAERDDSVHVLMTQTQAAAEGMKNNMAQQEGIDVNAVTAAQKDAQDMLDKVETTGLMVLLDKLIMLLSIALFRIGWWGTIYCQQILLGMLTIFGPIQWAFAVLPKWEGAWAKWIIRYLTVHFYGAMLYFVGFYVLLLFDIVLSVQLENLTAIVGTKMDLQGFINNAFMTAGYLFTASVVSLRCLNLVPDLAAWMIPEGDTAFSTRSFGEGVASGVKQGASGVMSKVM